jgi:branched-chain amino acid transport system ATP-binding protein
MLQVNDLHVYYGSYHILKGITFSMEDGEVFSVIGPNGSGKTTLIKAIMGFVKSKGSIKFKGIELTRLQPWMRIKAGISIVPEGRRLFPYLTVKENLIMGALSKRGYQDVLQEVFDLFPILEERQSQLASTLSGGEQQMLAIGRALMSKPKLLLIDEVSLGLMPAMVNKLFDTLKRLNETGVSILCVEQNAKKALEIAHRGCMIELGKIVLYDVAEKLRENPIIKRAYLGA